MRTAPARLLRSIVRSYPSVDGLESFRDLSLLKKEAPFLKTTGPDSKTTTTLFNGS